MDETRDYKVQDVGRWFEKRFGTVAAKVGNHHRSLGMWKEGTGYGIWSSTNPPYAYRRSAGARGEVESSTRARPLITGAAAREEQERGDGDKEREQLQHRLVRGVLPFGC
ncbi:hypothetical protein X777_13173 [Ooceraea biroi]|uniref:Uncharacterized protein n=1 Tax=Ooceraea biroi TaxID=2015173 RepID=A0A026VY46_OOCBI|nr:hypothetical protein X777_13173 [Ooceraea biroi]